MAAVARVRTQPLAARDEADGTSQRIDRVASKIESVQGGATPEVQEQLARSLRALVGLRQKGNNDLIDELEVAVNALLDDPPNTHLARRAISGVARELRYRGYTPATRVMAGLGILSYICAVGWLLFGGDVFGFPMSDLVGPAVFGWVGAAASIVTRIGVFRNVENPFLVGLTRPLLGAAFGIFTYLGLNSGVITLAGDLDTPQFYLAIAFIAGFSERFVPDLIGTFDGATATASASAEVSVDTAAGGASG